jgi:hypothetical protein
MMHMVVQMDIDATHLRQQLAEHYNSFVEPLEIGVEAAAPGVAVGFLLDDAGLFGEALAVHLHLERAVGAGVEGWVDVDEVDLAGELGEEGGDDILLVAPDEAVASLGVATAAEEVEGALALLGGLVHRLDGLEGESEA